MTTSGTSLRGAITSSTAHTTSTTTIVAEPPLPPGSLHIDFTGTTRSQLAQRTDVPEPIRALARGAPPEKSYADLQICVRWLMGESDSKALSQLLVGMKVTGLDLSQMTLTRAELTCLNEALKTATDVKVLSLACCGLWDDSSPEVAAVIGADSGLVNVDLSGNSLGNVALNAIGQALCVNRALVNLDLSNNIFDDKGYHHVMSAMCLGYFQTSSNTTLQTLNLDGNAIFGLLFEYVAAGKPPAPDRRQAINSLLALGPAPGLKFIGLTRTGLPIGHPILSRLIPPPTEVRLNESPGPQPSALAEGIGVTVREPQVAATAVIKRKPDESRLEYLRSVGDLCVAGDAERLRVLLTAKEELLDLGLLVKETAGTSAPFVLTSDALETLATAIRYLQRCVDLGDINLEDELSAGMRKLVNVGLRSLTLCGLPNFTRDPKGSDPYWRIDTLICADAPITPKALSRLAAYHWLNINQLVLRSGRLGKDHVEALQALCQKIPALTLEDNLLKGTLGSWIGVLAEPDSEFRKKVKHLDLSRNGIEAVEAATLLKSLHDPDSHGKPRLESLSLAGNPIFTTCGEGRCFVILWRCSGLESLDLSNTGFERAPKIGTKLLRIFPDLRCLILRNHRFANKEELRKLCRILASLQNLKALDVTQWAGSGGYRLSLEDFRPALELHVELQGIETIPWTDEERVSLIRSGRIQTAQSAS